MNFINRANSSKLVLPGMVYSIFISINHNWDEEKPRVIVHSRHKHQFSLNVRAGIIEKFLIGDVLFLIGLTGTKYVDFLTTRLHEILEKVPVDIRLCTRCMHDEAPPHFSRVARQFLNQHFANKWIGRGGPIAWPARSPDLNPLDFHLWGHLKSIVYATSIENAEILRNRIEQGFRQIRETPGMIERVTGSMTRRVQACLQMEGGHFGHLL